MKSTQTNVSGRKTETNVQRPKSKATDSKVSAKNDVSDAPNKRLDHHLIDQDLELEDKNGRRINPKAQEDRQ
ncbi:MAG: hypothetical protein H7256_01560 [Bdellovibrio sp.]|nr:hypothetical protein [Bdellovibrio sp.]